MRRSEEGTQGDENAVNQTVEFCRPTKSTLLGCLLQWRMVGTLDSLRAYGTLSA